MTFRIVLLVSSMCIAAWAEAAPRRIVALNPLLSEWTAAVLGDDYSRTAIVGVSEYSHHPALLKSIPTVGPYSLVNIERVAALKPDLVLASEEYNRPDQLEQLRRLRLNLRVLPKERFAGFGEWITKLGDALGEPAGAKRERERWEKTLQETLAQAGPAGASGPNGSAAIKNNRSYLIEIQAEPLITAGKQSILTEALGAAGFRNVFDDLDSGYPKVSIEAVLRRNPEWIFVLTHGGEEATLAVAKKRWARFRALRAVRAGRVVALSGDDFARCSLRLLNALKQLNSGHAP